jgi:hypothetical protein
LQSPQFLTSIWGILLIDQHVEQLLQQVVNVDNFQAVGFQLCNNVVHDQNTQFFLFGRHLGGNDEQRDCIPDCFEPSPQLVGVAGQQNPIQCQDLDVGILEQLVQSYGFAEELNGAHIGLKNGLDGVICKESTGGGDPVKEIKMIKFEENIPISESDRICSKYLSRFSENSLASLGRRWSMNVLKDWRSRLISKAMLIDEF